MFLLANCHIVLIQTFLLSQILRHRCKAQICPTLHQVPNHLLYHCNYRLFSTTVAPIQAPHLLRHLLTQVPRWWLLKECPYLHLVLPHLLASLHPSEGDFGIVPKKQRNAFVGKTQSCLVELTYSMYNVRSSHSSHNIWPWPRKSSGKLELAWYVACLHSPA